MLLEAMWLEGEESNIVAEAGNLVEDGAGWTLMAVSWDLVRCLQSSQDTHAWSRLEMLLLLISIWIRMEQKRMQASFIFVPAGKQCSGCW